MISTSMGRIIIVSELLPLVQSVAIIYMIVTTLTARTGSIPLLNKFLLMVMEMNHPIREQSITFLLLHAAFTTSQPLGSECNTGFCQFHVNHLPPTDTRAYYPYCMKQDPILEDM
jgi:hypothetical protein